ncbi:MAG: branched-chain amino acid ABC transporter permease [Dehalococcoidia bacterium]|nr:MAG: branched-chain amino acid ABC transporter permease [Dehalococcoidia bacterium]
MEFAIQTVANAWVATFLYAVLAVGLALIFGVMRTANFAHGEFFMVGAYVVWLLYSRSDWPFPVAVVAAMGIVTGIGMITELGVFRTLRGNVVAGLIASLGLVFILQVTVGRIWGLGLAKPVAPFFPGSLEILGANVGWQRFSIIPAGLTMLGILWLFLNRFKMGQALRATAQDPEAAALMGISINRMALLAMGISAAFAGVAGALMSSVYPVEPYMGHAVILMAFIIVIVGGTGSLIGAFVAAIMFGFIHTVVTTVFDSTVAIIIACVTMAIILAVRPKGLLGREKV